LRVLPTTVSYHRPASLAEAVDLLSRLEGDALPLAGGTDVIVEFGRGTLTARHVVALRDVPELAGVRRKSGRLQIGASTTPARIAASEAVAEARPELLDAVRAFGTPQVRNRATLGGNLCTATACADLPPILIACGATVRLQGRDGERSLPLADFFVGPRETVRKPSEILVDVTVAEKTPQDGAGYETFGLRRASFITVAGVAAWVRLDEGTCREARVVLGAVGPTPLFAREAGTCLVGGRLEAAALDEAAAAAARAALPISDVRGSADQRRHLVEVLTRRALKRALERTRA